MLNELLILTKIKAGDIKAFEELFRCYYSPLCWYAASITGRMEVAEEIVEELFYVLWKDREQLQIFQSVKNYLYRATRNQSIQYCEHEEVKERYRESVLTASSSEQATDPHQQMEYEELQKLINNTLEKLPERRMQIFKMHRTEGKKYAEIAVQLSLRQNGGSGNDEDFTNFAKRNRKLYSNEMMKTDIHKIKTEQAWNRLYDRLDKDHLLVEDHRMPKIPMWVRYGTVAAMVVGLVFSTLYWGFGQKEELPDFITQENQDVPTLVTTLEDGSVVFLAKETSIRYPEHFVSDKREVSLQGDAFFDVAKKQKQPFWIDTKEVKIEVLGTAFSVKSVEDAPFRLSVQRGTVRVTLKKRNKECYVKAGETVVLQSQQLLLSSTENAGELNRYLKHVCFKDESLGHILKVMNMNAGSSQIRVASPALEKRKLTVEFSNESPETVATLIAYALNLKCTRQGDTFILTE